MRMIRISKVPLCQYDLWPFRQCNSKLALRSIQDGATIGSLDIYLGWWRMVIFQEKTVDIYYDFVDIYYMNDQFINVLN